jgi:Glycosyl transferase family 11
MVEPWKIIGRLGNQMFMIAKTYADMRSGIIPDMYCQDDMYFREYENEIKQLFGSDIVPINQVAIHVRRGDYVGNKFYVDLTETTYYDEAMKYFPDENFLVFSDDIEFCKEYFVGEQFEFCEETDPVKSLNLMAGCKGIIMANSSFSWWASYLCKGKVIAPKKWYSDGVPRTATLDKWIKV